LLDGKIDPDSSLARVDKLLAGLVRDALKKEEFKGKPGEIKVIHTHYKIKAPYLFVVGLGERKKLDLEHLRKAAGKICQSAESVKAKKVVFEIAEDSKVLSPEMAGGHGRLRPRYLPVFALQIEERRRQPALPGRSCRPAEEPGGP
jgi:leucyl aminopeptidase